MVESRNEDLTIHYHNRSKAVTFDLANIRFINIGKPCPTDRQIFLTICIVSSPQNGPSRDVIRKTWASNSMNNKIHYIFMVGKSEVSGISLKIAEESKRENDIVFIDYEDSYRNLTYKSVAILKWSSIFCAESKYIVKIDDDIFVDIPALFNILLNITYPKVIVGHVIREALPKRRVKSKWFVGAKDYYKEIYPDYITGVCYAISTDLLQGMLDAANRCHILPIEDIYVTGILGHQAGARFVGNCGFSFTGISVEGWSRNHLVIMAHKYHPSEVQAIWDMRQSFIPKTTSWMTYLSHLLIV
ncbi:beta-1,3-galactosyltransferase 1 isoform X2 [Patella vulgata]|nr:beta-1,3-galactosyltransferase 1 isoform X2 [Patella vulgata]